MNSDSAVIVINEHKVAMDRICVFQLIKALLNDNISVGSFSVAIVSDSTRLAA